MRQNTALYELSTSKAPNGTSLTRRDLLEYEHAVKDALAAFVPFSSHSLFFPQSVSPAMLESFGPERDKPVFLPKERRLFLPLAVDGVLLGVFMAKGVKLAAPKTTLDALPRVAALRLGQILLHKKTVTDASTGLYNRDYLLALLEREIDMAHELIMPGSAGYLDPSLTGSRGCFGLVTLDIDGFENVVDAYGFVFADVVLKKAGAVLVDACPEELVAARTGDNAFTMFLPGATPARTREVATRAKEALAGARFEYPVTGEALALTAGAGCAGYPRDMRGGQFVAPVPEQARIMLDKAAKALGVAKSLGRDQAMAYGRILAEGGLVLETLPLSRVVVSLGGSAGAASGQRYLVQPPGPDNAGVVKGEIILMDVREAASSAEVLHTADPSWPIAPGDRLSPAPDAETAQAPAPGDPPQKDALSGLYGHKDFLRVLAGAAAGEKRFCLVLLRLPDQSPVDRGASGRHLEADVREIAAMCKTVFGPETVGGRYSSSKLVFYLPKALPGDALSLVRDICLEAVERLGVEIVAGVAAHPFLNFSKADIPENCRKALEHAQLLSEAPKAAVFDSISMTISADASFTQGDLYAAAEEYKTALLADEKNTLARNSLGICCARLGKTAQARLEFEKAARTDPKNAMAAYNLGCVLQRLGEAKSARKAFQKCLRINPEDVYSLLRLGRMAESDGRLANAQGYYDRAAKTASGGMAHAHLARVALKRKRPDEARSHLHDALVYDPKDAASLNLMAVMYLEEGDDPAIAEAMARQSAALRPDNPRYWNVLARALEAQGKAEEAKEAFARAGD